MGLMSWTLGLPLMPLRGTVALATVIERRAEEERRSAASVRRRLEAMEAERSGDTDPTADQRDDEKVREILGDIIPPTRVIATRRRPDGGDD